MKDIFEYYVRGPGRDSIISVLLLLSAVFLVGGCLVIAGGEDAAQRQAAARRVAGEGTTDHEIVTYGAKAAVRYTNDDNESCIVSFTYKHGEGYSSWRPVEVSRECD